MVGEQGQRQHGAQPQPAGAVGELRRLGRARRARAGGRPDRGGGAALVGRPPAVGRGAGWRRRPCGPAGGRPLDGADTGSRRRSTRWLALGCAAARRSAGRPRPRVRSVPALSCLLARTRRALSSSGRSALVAPALLRTASAPAPSAAPVVPCGAARARLPRRRPAAPAGRRPAPAAPAGTGRWCGRPAASGCAGRARPPCARAGCTPARRRCRRSRAGRSRRRRPAEGHATHRAGALTPARWLVGSWRHGGLPCPAAGSTAPPCCGPSPCWPCPAGRPCWRHLLLPC